MKNFDVQQPVTKTTNVPFFTQGEVMSKYLIAGLLALCLLVWGAQQGFSQWRLISPGRFTSTSHPSPGMSTRWPATGLAPRQQDPLIPGGSIAYGSSLDQNPTASTQVPFVPNTQENGAGLVEQADRMAQMQAYMRNMLGGGDTGTTSPELELYQQIQAALSRYQAATVESGERPTLRIEISELLGRQYDSHIKTYEQQVAELEQRLAGLREQVQKRRDAKSRLVALKLELLLSQAEGIGWPDAFPALGHPGRVVRGNGMMPAQAGLPGMVGTDGSLPPAGSMAGADPNFPIGNMPFNAQNSNSLNIVNSEVVPASPSQLSETNTAPIIYESSPAPGTYDAPANNATTGSPGPAAESQYTPSVVNPPAASESVPGLPEAMLDPAAQTPAVEYWELPKSQNAPDDSPVPDGFESETTAKALLLAVHNYHDAYQEFPFHSRANQSDKLNWLVRVLPYLGITESYHEFDLNQAWNSETNVKLIDRMPKIFGEGRQTRFRWIESDARRISEILDGTSNTIACIYGGPPVYWTENRPLSTFEAVEIFEALPPDGELVVAFYDGFVRKIKPEIGVDAFRALLTPRGGEVVHLPW
ncbi:MAG: DUF1559 domain-containing protein [Planctomycetaceae bacterium]|nr:DUF1559 domain-containing protein [Planctomycetaceae bacterium]